MTDTSSWLGESGRGGWGGSGGAVRRRRWGIGALSMAMALSSEKSEPHYFAERGYPPGTGQRSGATPLWPSITDVHLYRFPEGNSPADTSPMSEMQATVVQNYRAAMLQQMGATSPPGYPGMYFSGVPYGYGGGHDIGGLGHDALAASLPATKASRGTEIRPRTESGERTESQESAILTEDLAVAGMMSGGAWSGSSPVPGPHFGSTPTPNASPTPSKGSKDSSRREKWTVEEHRLFLKGLEVFGKGSWRDVSRHYVKTKTCTQVASHAQKYFKRQASAAAARELGADTGRKRASIHDTALLPDNVPQNDLVSSMPPHGLQARPAESFQVGYPAKSAFPVPEHVPFGSKSALTAGLVSPFVPVVPAAPAASPVAKAGRQDFAVEPSMLSGAVRAPSGSPSFGRFVDIVLDMDGDLLYPCK